MSPEIVQHAARIAYVNAEHGLVKEQWVHQLARPFLELVTPSFKPWLAENPNYHIGWIDFRCDSGGACGFPQTHGGNPKDLCGDTLVAVAKNDNRYSFRTSLDLIAEPDLITDWATGWLRKLADSDIPHPPFPASRSDEIRGVLAKVPMRTTVSPDIINRTEHMIDTLHKADQRRRGEII